MEDNTRRRIRRIRLGLPNRSASTEALLLGQGALAGDGGLTLSQWLADNFNTNFDAYDRAIDSVYNATRIGGSSYHHLVDGKHNIFSAFHAVEGVSADDSWLTEIAQASEHLLRDTASVSGINPFHSLTPDQFDHVGSLASTLGISKPFLADALTVNGSELLGGALCLVGSVILARKADPIRLSRLAGGCVVSGLAAANPLMMPIAAGSLAYAAYQTGDTKDALMSAGKGGLVSGGVILVSGIVGGPAWLGCVAGMLAGVAVAKAVEDPAKTLQRAQQLMQPAAEILKQVTWTLSEVSFAQ